MEDFKELVKAYYKSNVCALVSGGAIQFDPKSLNEVAGAEKLTYDEYIDIQIRSLGKQRSSFEACYFNIPAGFKGQIEKISKKHICFQRIFVSGMYPDGTFFDGKEDHVWMEKSEFESFKVGDCVEFYAEVYRYLKTGNGKLIDYSLRNSEEIKKIPAYELPSDEELMLQAMKQIICETCLFSEHCDRVFCLRNP